jgi:hypothetical protein
VFAFSRKAPITFVWPVNPFVRLAAGVSAVPTGQISVKVGIWNFRENLLRKFKFG